MTWPPRPLVHVLQMVRRLGCWATLYSIISNQLLKDNVSEGEALIDSIAVAPDCQGRGFGSALLKWCQATVAAEAPPGTVSNLYLWVRLAGLLVLGKHAGPNAASLQQRFNLQSLQA